MTGIPTADELESFFRAGKMERLGDGARRVCYALPGGKFCVKSYRSEEELETHMRPDGSLAEYTLKPSVIKEIRKARFDEKRNTSCQEYRYWKKLKEELPADVFSVFPRTMECVLVPSRGWCVVEERVENFDGSRPSRFSCAYRAADGEGRGMLLSALDALASQFISFAVRLYDPQNLIVQKLGDGEFRLRLVDFEPATRCFIPIDSMFPALVRRKTNRRIDRWLFEQMGVEDRVKAASIAAGNTVSMSFSVSDNYSQHLAVVLTSVLANNPASRFVFHVLHRNISAENQLRIKGLERGHPACEIRFHRVDAAVFERFPIPGELEHVTRETYYRYVLPDMLGDEDRTIYSDVDVLCVGDLRPLWGIDLKGNVLAAVSEGEHGEYKKRLIGLEGGDYFNAGVLVMDLGRMRAEDATKTLFANTLKYAGRIAWPDQDIINITFNGRILALEPIWNGFNVAGRKAKRRVVIRHFASATQKPWCNIWKNTAWPGYLKYLSASPYRSNAWNFVWGHIKGFFFFRYTKKGVTRYLVCGIRVWRRKRG